MHKQRLFEIDFKERVSARRRLRRPTSICVSKFLEFDICSPVLQIGVL